MKQLTLIRHSKTEVIYEGIGDFERKLKSRGRNDAKLIAEYLKSKEITPDVIISSNAVRAIQTAEEMARVYGYPFTNIKVAPFIYNGYTTAEFLDYISELDNSKDSAWVIGHNPEIALLGMNLTHEDFFHFPTTSSVTINFKVDKWSDIAAREGQTALFVTPRKLKDSE